MAKQTIKNEQSEMYGHTVYLKSTNYTVGHAVYWKETK